MKTNALILVGLAVFSLMLSSCTTTYYQVYRTVPSSNVKQDSNVLVYEDENCRISYDFWEQGGNAGFIFYNKTNENLYVNLGGTFFIRNGVAYDYYKNRVYTESLSAQASDKVGLKVAKQSTVSINEKEVVCVPPHSMKSFKEYDVTNELFRSCELLLYPKMKQESVQEFSKSNSPLVFSNVISYVKADATSKTIQTEFYVSQIANYPERKMTEYKADVFCGEKANFKKLYLKRGNANEFYFSYKRELLSKH